MAIEQLIRIPFHAPAIRERTDYALKQIEAMEQPKSKVQREYVREVLRAG